MTRLCALALALVATGCEPLADRTYAGEALFTLEGTLSEALRPLRVDAEVALLWQDPATAGGPGLDAMAIPFAIEPLGGFTARVPVPPRAVVRFRFDDGGPEIAEAYVHMVTGVPVTTDMLDLGLDLGHAVVFAAGDVEGGAAADYLGGPVTAGYHLRAFTVTTTPGAAQRQLIERCVASTGDRGACEARRGYQLEATDDAAPLRITLRVR